MIKSLSQKAMHYTTLEEYRKAWHLLFDNARRYNIDGSQVYEDADYLQKVFDRKLYMLSHLHNIPGHERLPRKSLFCGQMHANSLISVDLPSRAASPNLPSVEDLIS
jgi:hypothetical protein